MRRIQLVSTLLAVAALLPAASPAAPQAPATVQVHFLQGEQLVARARPGSTVRAAVAALLAGPNAAERRAGVRTYVPERTPLRAVSFTDGVATVDLGERFASGRDAEELDARIAQLAFTATGARGGWRAARPLPRLRALPAGDARAGDAAVLDAPILAAERAAAPYRYGPLAGVIRTGERYGVVLPKGSTLTTRVDAAVRALVANGTLTRLQRRWLTADLGRLRVLG